MKEFGNVNFSEKDIQDYLIFKDDLVSLNKNLYAEDKEIINWAFIYRKILKNILVVPQKITFDELKIKISIIKKNIKDYQLKKSNYPQEKKTNFTSTQIIDYFTYILKKKKFNQNELNNVSSIKSLEEIKNKEKEILKTKIKKEKESLILSQKNIIKRNPIKNLKTSLGFGLLDKLNNVYENYNTNKKTKNIFNTYKSKSPLNINNNNNITFNLNSFTTSTKNKTTITNKKIISKNKENAEENDYYFELKGGDEIKLNDHQFFNHNKHNTICIPYIKQFNNQRDDIEPNFSSQFYYGLFNFHNLFFESKTKNLDEDQELQRARITCDNILTKFNPSIKKESNLINIEKYK